MRIIFYAIDGVGIGHINRTVAVAREIRKMKPDAHQLFITNSGFTKFFEENGFPFVRIPSNWSELIIEMDHVTKNVSTEVQAGIVNSIIDSYKPDVVIYDTHFPRNTIFHTSNKGVKNILVLRKFENEYFESALRDDVFKKFDLILLPHAEEEFKNVPKSLMSKLIDLNCHFVGPIVREEKAVADIRKKYGIKKNDFLVLVTAGGGGYPGTKEFVDTAVETCKKLKNHIPNAKCIIIPGPLYKKSANASEGHITTISFEPHMLGLMRASDLIVSQAGYNIGNEIILAKTPAILMPGYRDSESQYERAAYLEKKGIAKVLTEFDADMLLKHILVFHDDRRLQRKMKEAFSKIKLKTGNKKIAEMIVKLADRTAEIKIESKGIKDKLEAFIKKDIDQLVLHDNGAPEKKIIETVKYAKKIGFEFIQLRIRGEELGDEKSCRRIAGAGIDSFIVSIRSLSAKIANSIKGIIDADRHILCDVTVTKDNYKQLPEIAKYLIDLGVIQIQLTLTKSISYKKAEPYISKALRLRLRPETNHVQIYLTGDRMPQMAFNSLFCLESVLTGLHKKMDSMLDRYNLTETLGRLRRKIKTLEQNRDLEWSKLNLLENGLKDVAIKQKMLLDAYKLSEEWKTLERKIKILEQKRNLEWSKLDPLNGELKDIALEQKMLLDKHKITNRWKKLEKRIRSLEIKRNIKWDKLKSLDRELQDMAIKQKMLLDKHKITNRWKKLEKRIRMLELKRNAEWDKLKSLNAELQEIALKQKRLLDGCALTKKWKGLEREIKLLEQKRNLEWSKLNSLEACLKDIAIKQKKLLDARNLAEKWKKLEREKKLKQKEFDREILRHQRPIRKQKGELLERQAHVNPFSESWHEFETKINDLKRKWGMKWDEILEPIEVEIDKITGRQRLLLKKHGILDEWDELDQKKRKIELELDQKRVTMIDPLEQKIKELEGEQRALLRNGGALREWEALDGKKKKIELKLNNERIVAIEQLEQKIKELEGEQRALLRENGILKEWGKLEERKRTIELRIEKKKTLAIDRIEMRIKELEGQQRSLLEKCKILNEWERIDRKRRQIELELDKKRAASIDHVEQRISELSGEQRALLREKGILKEWERLDERKRRIEMKLDKKMTKRGTRS